MNRTRRKHIAACLICLLLFMQMAVSAYACMLGGEASRVERDGSPVAAATDQKPCHAAQSEPQPSNLCKAHCAQPSQSVDTRAPIKLDLAHMPALVPTLPPSLLLLDHLVSRALARPAPPDHPPLYLDHCRFLI